MNNETETVNYKYAPGIATYGIDGKDGSKGDAGTSFYFSSYVIDSYSSTSDSDYNSAITKIKDNLVLSKKTEYSATANVRDYADGDIIIDTAGNLNRIKFSDSGVPYFQFITTLSNFSSDTYFRHSTNSNRIYLDTSSDNVTGFDILSGTYASSDITEGSDYLERVIQTNKNSNDIYGLVSLIAKDNTNNVNYLDITYNQNISSFVLSSNSYISIDASKGFFVNIDNTDDVISSDYYKIRPYADPIGLLHLAYKDSSVYMTTDSSASSASGTEYVFFITIPVSKNVNIDVKPDTVKIDTYSSTDSNMISNEYMISPPSSDWIIYDSSSYLYVFSLGENDLSRIKHISLTKGITVYKEILGFSEDDSFGYGIYQNWKSGSLI